MNKGIVFHYLSKALLLSSALFLVPALVSLYYREYFFMLIFLGVGGGMALASLPGVFYRPRHKYMFAREGMVIAALMWIIFSAVGALPFYCSGSIPHYIDALFESVSGFTTTGSSILTDIEALPRGSCSGEASPTGSAAWAYWCLPLPFSPPRGMPCI